MTNRPVDDDPEPIDAEFEPASGPEPVPSRRAPKRAFRSRSATLQELLVSSVLAAVLGAIVAIIVGNASSGAPTGTLAREIDNLVRGQSELVSRSDQAAAEIISFRSRLDAQAERLDAQNAAEALLRSDLAALASQLSAVSGAGDGSTPRETAAAKSPLGILLGRINRLEGIVEEDKASPQTTREVQRAIANLADQVTALDLANTTLVAAFDRREAALAALETGMRTMAADITMLNGGKPPAARNADARIATAPPILAATARSQAIRALSALEAAARGDRPFGREHQALAALLPGEADLNAMADAARTGVVTVAQLRSNFAAASERAQRLATDESDDGWNWLRTAFTGVIDFEPSPLVASNRDIIRNARRQLDLGDVQGAIEAISGVSGKAGAAFTAWRTLAQQRATVDANLRDLNARLLEAAAANGNAG